MSEETKAEESKVDNFQKIFQLSNLYDQLQRTSKDEASEQVKIVIEQIKLNVLSEALNYSKEKLLNLTD